MIRLVLALVAAASVAQAAPSSANGWQETLDRVSPAVVVLRITSPRAFDGESAGVSTATGFVVDARRGLILSNRHVVQTGPVVAEAVFLDHEEVPVRAIYRDPVHDFGFFRFDPSAVRFMEVEELELAPEAAKVGSEIRLIGNDAGEKLSILAGTIARLDRAAPRYGRHGFNDFNTFYIQAASGASGGSSGSPVVDVSGRVVALNAAGKRFAASSFFLPLERVVRALDLLRRDEPVTRGTLQTVFRHRPYDELRRLGLGEEAELAMRKRFPAGTGGIVVDELVPGGPADGLLEPGDIVISVDGEAVTTFLPIERALDEALGRSVAIEIERRGQRMRVEPIVGDLHALIPTEYLEIGQTVIHPLSIHGARNRAVPVRGLVVASPGNMLLNAGVPRGALITHVGDRAVDDLDALEAEFAAIPQGEGVALRYAKLDRSRGEGVAVVRLPRRWFPLRRCRRAAEGRWTCLDAPEAPPAPPPLPSTVRLAADGSKAMRRLAHSLVLVDFEIPIRVDGVYGSRFRGAGLVVDADLGLVVVDRDTVPVSLGDAWLTFGGSVRIPAEVQYLHPEHNLAVLRYQPGRLGDTPVESAALRPAALSVGDAVELIGLSDEGILVSRRTAVSRRRPVALPVPFPPRFRDRNLELLALADRTPTIGGVLADKKGRVSALWASFPANSGKANSSFFAGIDIERVVEMIEPLRQGRDVAWRSLGIELRSLGLAQARELGLTQAQAEALEAADPVSTGVLSVERIAAGSPAETILREGDLLLRAAGDIVTRFDQVERAAQSELVSLLVVRDGVEHQLQVATRALAGRGTDRALLWAGAVLQLPHPPVVEQYAAPEPGVYVAWLGFGSPANRYQLPTTHRIVAVDGHPTPDLDSFLGVVSGVADRGAVRLRTRSLSGRVSVTTLQLDLEHWPTAELVDGADGWRRHEISAP